MSVAVFVDLQEGGVRKRRGGGGPWVNPVRQTTSKDEAVPPHTTQVITPSAMPWVCSDAPLLYDSRIQRISNEYGVLAGRGRGAGGGAWTRLRERGTAVHAAVGVEVDSEW